ncbi:MAG: hypothetical protein LLG14_17730 [Nocardiaceae bacterium]|nr:hypothetical protein [Nocardiaceae bacterium]
MPTHKNNCLAVLVIEALQSTVCSDADTEAVVDRYCAYRQAQGSWQGKDGARALLRTFEDVGGCLQWVGKVGNYRRRYSATSTPIAATAIERVAELFYRHRIDSIADFNSAINDPTRRKTLESDFTAISGDPHAWHRITEMAKAKVSVVA